MWIIIERDRKKETKRELLIRKTNNGVKKNVDILTNPPPQIFPQVHGLTWNKEKNTIYV